MFDVIKYHRIENGETSSAVKYETYEDALKNYHQFASNYMADNSVLAWGLGIAEVTSDGNMKMVKRENYVKPVEPEPEMTVEEAKEIIRNGEANASDLMKAYSIAMMEIGSEATKTAIDDWASA